MGKENPAFLPSTYMTPAKTSVSITRVLPVGCHVWMKSCCCCATGRRSSVTWLSRAPPSSSCCRFAGSRLQLVYKEHYSKRRRSGEEAGERGWRWFEYFTSLLDPTEKYIRLFRVIRFSIFKSYSKFRNISKQRWLTGLEDLTWTTDEETTDLNYSYHTISAFNSHTNPNPLLEEHLQCRATY